MKWLGRYMAFRSRNGLDGIPYAALASDTNTLYGHSRGACLSIVQVTTDEHDQGMRIRSAAGTELVACMGFRQEPSGDHFSFR